MTVILLIEDQPALRRAMVRRLGRRHVVISAGDAAEARALFEIDHERIEVVVTDINLPDGDGIDLIRGFRTLDPTIGAVVATGLDDPQVAERVVSSQVQGYLLKPFEHTELEVNIANADRWRALELENRRHRAELTRLVEVRTAEVRESRWETIRRLSMAAEHRDPETANHLERMSSYSAILARRAGLDPDRCEEIRLASPMHDIGKLGIPDEILTHDGVFEDHHRAIMNQHTVFGWQILSGSDSTLLETAAIIAYSHHEWWDGRGYPRGLSGTEIPIEGRIVAIADVFDALTSQRRYKRAFSFDEAIAIMAGERGTHFDPDLLDAFLDDLDEVAAIQRAFDDALVKA